MREGCVGSALQEAAEFYDNPWSAAVIPKGSYGYKERYLPYNSFDIRPALDHPYVGKPKLILWDSFGVLSDSAHHS